MIFDKSKFDSFLSNIKNDTLDNLLTENFNNSIKDSVSAKFELTFNLLTG